MRPLPGLFRTKSLRQLEECSGSRCLRRALGPLDLVLLGIGCIVGTGIFVLTGVAAAQYAGPGIVFSFLIAGLACVLTAFVYAELASMIPFTGSTYTFAYVALGEIVAWLVGWTLLLEYLIAACMVSVGWSAYVTGVFQAGGLVLPHALTAPPADGGLLNVPAILIALLICGLLILGIRESARVNNVMVGVKTGAILLFLALAAPRVQVSNWEPLLPYGLTGILTGSAIVFTAFIGFDAVTTATEECKNPRRDLPIGIIGSIVVCTFLYVAVSAVLTGVVPYTQLNTPEPMTYALRSIGFGAGSAVVGVGAIAGITTVLLVLYYGLTRIVFAMSRDGLIPARLCRVHPRFGTPYLVTALAGCIIAAVAGLAPIGALAELVNIGTLFAFIMASLGAIVLRIRKPEAARPFRCPGLFFVAPLSIGLCLLLMAMLPLITWVRFVLWMAVGVVIYAGYGYGRSIARKQ